MLVKRVISLIFMFMYLCSLRILVDGLRSQTDFIGREEEELLNKLSIISIRTIGLKSMENVQQVRKALIKFGKTLSHQFTIIPLIRTRECMLGSL